MFNIIKSQNYQLRHDIFSVIAAIIFMGISIYMAVCDSVTGGEKFLSFGENIPMLWVVVCLLFGARIAAWDFNDKTINYELLAGHSRKTMYWGRFVTAFLWCSVICYLMIVIPLVICTAKNGWGDNVDFVNCMIRILIAVFPMIRILAEFFLLAVIMRNCYSTYAVGYVLIGGSMMLVLILSELLDMDLTYFLGFSMLGEVLELSNSHLELVNGVDIYVYESAIAIGDMIKIAIWSIGVCVVCLLGGYQIFKKRDME